MILLAQFLAPGLAAAGLIGLLAGWFRFAAARRRGARADLLVSCGLLILLAGLHVAALAGHVVLAGRPALWADSALLHLAAYLAGAAIGGVLNRLVVSRRVNRPGAA